jgi:Methylamine utilisation protein MauE
MTPLAGPVHAAALVLAVAGFAKFARPAGTAAALRTLRLPGTRLAARALGAVEIALAIAVLAGTGAGAAAAVALLHVGFALAAVVLQRRSTACGCFGDGAPVTGVHVAAAVVVATLFAIAVFDEVPSLAAAVDATPAAGIPYAVLAGLLAAGEVLCLTALPAAQVAARNVSAAR